VPASFYDDPLMYQGASDTFIGPRDDILASDEAYGIDMEVLFRENSQKGLGLYKVKPLVLFHLLR